MRKGYWIILDELNLAPTDVLEALNRLLDDNRELFVAETQEVIKAHPRFMLFATQNPPGLYGGRKVYDSLGCIGFGLMASLSILVLKKEKYFRSRLDRRLHVGRMQKHNT